MVGQRQRSGRHPPTPTSLPSHILTTLPPVPALFSLSLSLGRCLCLSSSVSASGVSNTIGLYFCPALPPCLCASISLARARSLRMCLGPAAHLPALLYQNACMERGDFVSPSQVRSHGTWVSCDVTWYLGLCGCFYMVCSMCLVPASTCYLPSPCF